MSSDARIHDMFLIYSVDIMGSIQIATIRLIYTFRGSPEGLSNSIFRGSPVPNSGDKTL